MRSAINISPPHRPPRSKCAAPALLALAALLAAPNVSTAQPVAASAPAPVAAPPLAGRTFDGRDFDLARQRGRVVMLVLWSTDCAVCLDKLPELRENARGWVGKPFDLVTVALDPLRGNAEAYEQARRATRQGEGAAWTLWQGAVTMPAEWKQSRPLPHTLLIDREGRVVARYNGRIPADAWNMVADLLP